MTRTTEFCNSSVERNQEPGFYWFATRCSVIGLDNSCQPLNQCKSKVRGPPREQISEMRQLQQLNTTQSQRNNASRK